MVLGLFARGGGKSLSVGEEIATSSAGRQLIDKRLADSGLDATKANKEKITQEFVAEVNQGFLKKTQGFSTKLDNAIGKSSQGALARIAADMSEQASKYADDLAKTLGDPKLAKPLKRSMLSRTNRIYMDATKANARKILGKTGKEVGQEAGEQIAKQSLGSRLLNGVWANKGPLAVAGLAVAGVGFIMWGGVGTLLSDVTTTLERWGFLPEGATQNLITFWGKLRGFITVAIWLVVGFGVFYIMNMIFGTAKAVGKVVDTVTPDSPDSEATGA